MDPQTTPCAWGAVVDVVELLGQPIQVPDAVPVAVVERANEDLVADGALLPPGVGSHRLADGRGLRNGSAQEGRREGGKGSSSHGPEKYGPRA